MVELGYDESVQRGFDEQRGQYCHVFRVGDSYFKTLRSIDEHLNTCITGRATRVFEVIKVPGFNNLTEEPTASRMVLKDVWLDIVASTEKEIQSAIFERLEEVARKLQEGQDLPHFAGLSDTDKALLHEALRDENYKRYFLTIDCDTRGAPSKSCPPDSSRPEDVFSPRASGPVPAKFSHGDDSRSLPVPPSARPLQRPSSQRSYLAKYSYRVVFKEVCEALHYVDNSKNVFKAMNDCLLGKKFGMLRVVKS